MDDRSNLMEAIAENWRLAAAAYRAGDLNREDHFARMAQSLSAAHPLPSAASAAAKQKPSDREYTPTLIAFDDPPRIEYINADVSPVSRRIDERFDLLLDMDTREPIGFTLYGQWKQAFDVEPPEVKPPVVGDDQIQGDEPYTDASVSASPAADGIPDFIKRQTGELPPAVFPKWGDDDGREGRREGAEED